MCYVDDALLPVPSEFLGTGSTHSNNARLKRVCAGKRSRLGVTIVLPAILLIGSSNPEMWDSIVFATGHSRNYAVDTRALKVYDYYHVPDVTLTQGTYTVVTPSAVNPLIVEGTIKRTLNNKYEKIAVEGVGKFTRRIDQAVTVVYQNGNGVENPADVWLYILRFYFPHSNVLGFFYDENNEPQSEIHLEATVTVDLDPPFVISDVLADDDIKRVTDTMDANFNKLYRDYALVIPGHVGQPAVVVTNAKLRYTSYDGPLVAEAVSADPRLKGEGIYPVQRPDLFAFSSAGYAPLGVTMELMKAIDPTMEMTTQAGELLKRYGTRPDVAGRVAAHIKELTGSIIPGSRITNFDARVQSIEIDVINRNLLLDLSDVPIRREVQDQKDAAVLRSETVRQLSVNGRVGEGDVSPIRMASFNRNANMVREDCCDECDCEGS